MKTIKTLASVLGGIVLAYFCPHKALAETEKSPGSRLLDLVYEVMPAIAEVESGGDPKAKGDKNKKTGRYDAVGMFQLHVEYIKDVNRITKLMGFHGTPFTPADRLDPNKSRQMVKIYLAHYGREYQRKTQQTVTAEVLARCHNGGPRGYAKKSTEKYWLKVKAVMDSE